MKIGIVGFYGKLGKTNYNVIKDAKGCSVAFGISRSASNKGDVFDNIKVYNNIFESYEECEGVIDFSNRENIKSSVNYCLEKNIPLVIGTTGLNGDDEAIILEASKYIPILLSHNTAYGVNVLFDIVNSACKKLYDFDIEIIEKHHNRKEDAPSGTSKLIFNSLKEANPNLYTKFGREGSNSKRNHDEVGFHSVRAGSIISDHDVIFASGEEVITISHRALSDEVFAKGALKALLFLKEKNSGLYDMKDIFL